jgi:transglutaminase-like putative cysteine protease
MSRLAVRLSNLPDGLALDGGRQTFDPATQRLTIQRETVGSLAASAPPAPETLLPSPLIEADHPLIRQRVLSLIDPSDAPLLRIRKIMDWIAAHIEKRPVLSLPSALATLEQGMGDCNEHAALLAAMARAAGIPAQVEAGLVYNEGRFFYHAWNLLWLDGWVTADALMGQLPADVTHIRLVRGEAAEQLDLLGAIGKAALTVLEE